MIEMEQQAIVMLIVAFSFIGGSIFMYLKYIRPELKKPDPIKEPNSNNKDDLTDKQREEILAWFKKYEPGVEIIKEK